MGGLVLELQQDALDTRVSVADLLRKTLVVAQKLKVPELREWVGWELNGYETDDSIPEYRHIGGVLKALNPLNGWIPVLLDDRIMEMVTRRKIGQPLPELEATIRSVGNTGMFHLPFAPSQQRLLMEMTGYDWQFALHLPEGSLVGIINGVRNAVLNWALQLEEQGVIGEGMTFTEKERQVAASLPPVVNYYGSVGKSQVMSNSPGSHQVMNERGLDRRAVLPLLAEIKRAQGALGLDDPQDAELTAEIATVEAQLASPRPKQTIMAESLATIRRILEGAATGAAGNLVSQLVGLLM